MINSTEIKEGLLSRLANIAIRIEGKGQYNIAKYIRASIDSLLREQAFKLHYDTDDDGVLNDFEKLIGELSEMGFETNFIRTLKMGYQKIDDNEISFITEFPDPIVCRRCGMILNLPEKEDYRCCHRCGADIDTFFIHKPIYWMREFDPIEGLENLKATPVKYASLLERITNEDAEKKTATPGWSVLEIIKHIKDAEGVLNLRIKLITENDNPNLAFKKVWAWADKPAEKKETLETVMEQYKKSRTDTISVLESIPLKHWWRPAMHEEFGAVNLKEQVSYFAAHELSHIRQLVNHLK